jgi:predicted RNA binding protein YcfA (HicA-like mRNA interferase family)
LRLLHSGPKSGRQDGRYRSGAKASDAPATIDAMKVAGIIKLLENDGWYLVGTTGSHRHFKHPTEAGRVMVAGKISDDLHAKTW